MTWMYLGTWRREIITLFSLGPGFAGKKQVSISMLQSPDPSFADAFLIVPLKLVQWLR